ncbi:MAG: methylmalonyl-CoA epimerase [Herpetosiphonaceae bacterium]|nr:methylmalonyl-CoA epimerase [Herpetosiphonaceae bacterium]
MLKRIDHIGIAVNDLERATAFYGATYGVTAWERIEIPERYMAVAVTRIGDISLELITPTDPQAAFANYLAEHGEGVHHIAYEVDDIEASLHTLEGRGIRLVDAHGRPGIHHTCVAFLHPKATMGVLTELVQLPTNVHASETY